MNIWVAGMHPSAPQGCAALIMSERVSLSTAAKTVRHWFQVVCPQHRQCSSQGVTRQLEASHKAHARFFENFDYRCQDQSPHILMHIFLHALTSGALSCAYLCMHAYQAFTGALRYGPQALPGARRRNLRDQHASFVWTGLARH